MELKIKNRIQFRIKNCQVYHIVNCFNTVVVCCITVFAAEGDMHFLLIFGKACFL